MQKKILNFC